LAFVLPRIFVSLFWGREGPGVVDDQSYLTGNKGFMTALEQGYSCSRWATEEISSRT